MTIGTDMLAALKRRLGEQGLTMEAGRETDLYAELTDARDELKQEMVQVAPFAFFEIVALEQESEDPPRWKFPDASNDPLRVVFRDSGNLRELEPSSELNQDAGEYALLSPRLLQLADHVSLEGDPEAAGVLDTTDAIDAAAEQAEVGMPRPCNRAIVLKAAVNVLTADEESDATEAQKLYDAAKERLENLYGGFDMNDGLKLRHALMRSEGRIHGDMLD